MFYLIQFIFYSIPIAAVLFCVISLYRFCSAKIKNKKEPNSFSAKEIKIRKLLLIVSVVIVVVLVAVVIGFIVSFSMAVMNM